MYTSWGSFYYDAADDALRINVKNQKLEKSVEWLKYEFTNETDSTATIAMSWEKRMIPFTITADTKALQIAAFRNDFRTTRPYYDYIQAANYCIQNNIALEQALAWMDRAIYFRVMGEKNFRTLATKASVLIKMNRVNEALVLMQEALPMGTMSEVHFYGRQLIGMGQKEEALKVYKKNFERYPNVYTTNVGMGRAYSAVGDYRKALPYMKNALTQAPDETNKANVENMIKKLQEGKDVN